MEAVTQERDCCEARWEDLCDEALKHYDELATAACHFKSIVPDAIRFYKEHGNPKDSQSQEGG